MAEAEAAADALPPGAAAQTAARLRRWSFWALPLVLLAALALHGRESALAWWRAKELFPQRLRLDAAAELGGAEWRVTSLQRVADRPDGSSVVLLEIEATVRDPALLGQLPCRIALEDRRGRRWLTTFLPPSEARRLLRQKGSSAKSCGPAVAGKPEPGTVLQIAEAFLLPRDAFGEAEVVVSPAAGRPRYLRFVRD